MENEDSRREFLLSALRGAALRAKLYETDINSVGVALKGRMVTPDEAVKWAKDIGIIDWLGPIPSGFDELDGERKL